MQQVIKPSDNATFKLSATEKEKHYNYRVKKILPDVCKLPYLSKDWLMKVHCRNEKKDLK